MMFNNVRVPKIALLDKLCTLSDDGVYESKYSKSKRFALTLQAASGGRLILAKGSTVSHEKNINFVINRDLVL
jgi:hypothetical protein